LEFGVDERVPTESGLTVVVDGLMLYASDLVGPVLSVDLFANPRHTRELHVEPLAVAPINVD